MGVGARPMGLQSPPALSISGSRWYIYTSNDWYMIYVYCIHGVFFFLVYLCNDIYIVIFGNRKSTILFPGQSQARSRGQVIQDKSQRKKTPRSGFGQLRGPRISFVWRWETGNLDVFPMNTWQNSWNSMKSVRWKPHLEGSFTSASPISFIVRGKVLGCRWFWHSRWSSLHYWGFMILMHAFLG